LKQSKVEEVDEVKEVELKAATNSLDELMVIIKG
jgi:hypothetical protein